jgi:SAM-dependent methyltransferase
MSDLFSADRLHGDDFSDAEIAEWFADEQRGYFEMSGGEANQRPLYEALYGLTLFRHIAARRFGSCLAIGAAGGTDVAKMAPQVDRFIVVEPTREFWRESINGTPSSYRTPNLRGALELADDSIDIATTINVLHHIPNVTDVLREVHRVLKPGALLLLQEPSSSMGDWRRPRAGATKHERGISPEWFKRSLDTIGFDIERATPCHFAPLLHIVSRLGVETFRSPLLTRIDLALCRLTAWNARYWRPRLLDKFAPGKISIVAKKRDRTAPGREDG